MAKAKIFYLLSEAGRKDSLLKGGDGKELQVIETEATPEIIELAQVLPDGQIWLPVGCGIERWSGKPNSDYPIMNYKLYTGYYEKPHLTAETKLTLFDTVQTVEKLIEWEKNRLANVERSKQELQDKLQAAIAKYEEEQAKREAARKAREEELKEIERKREAEKEAREKERAEWIKQYGSDYLKDCLELGVSANLEYVVERAAMEFPGFTVDYTDNANWERRFSPSHEALEELKALRNAGVEDSDIFWLTRPAKVRDEDDDDDYDFEPCEAIIIRNYLGKYDLVKII